ncbi:hypothetical protein SBA2_590028 [Acidobacteriia bacterium SbA2]|nr:hypothetical protein SBA2_590028 [Acidobacteriia bacterium SbA2]
MGTAVSRKLHKGYKSVRQRYKFVPPHLTYVARGLAGSHVGTRQNIFRCPMGAKKRSSELDSCGFYRSAKTFGRSHDGHLSQRRILRFFCISAVKHPVEAWRNGNGPSCNFQNCGSARDSSR